MLLLELLPSDSESLPSVAQLLFDTATAAAVLVAARPGPEILKKLLLVLRDDPGMVLRVVVPT